MGHQIERVPLGYIALENEALKDIAQNMSASVLEACRADAVLFCFNAALSAPTLIPVKTANPNAELVNALQELWENRARRGGEYGPGGLVQHISDQGEMYFLILLPLEADGQCFGGLAIAIRRENWVEQRAFAACTQIAQLVAMNVIAVQTRSQLELDLAEMNQRSHHLLRRAEVDPLTDVENKASFEAKARARLSDTGIPAALLILDLDFFKQVNDIYGHQFGDTYLQTIARSAVSSLPETALVGRIGGDEFGILVDLPKATPAYLNGVLTRLRSAIQRNVAMLGKADLGRVSIGGALFPLHAASYDQLFAMADSTLYACKYEGRNMTMIYDPEQHPLQTCTETSFKSTDFSQISPRFQPILDLGSGACVGLEILARHTGAPEDGSPAPVGTGARQLNWMFDHHYIAPRLTRHILQSALSHLGTLAPGNPFRDLDIWLNLTKFDLLDPEFVFDVQILLDQGGIGWDRVVIEVNEEIMLGERSGQIYHSLQEMRQRGARVALDDFGTGYAGLTHVRDWPVDVIKIDQSFVQNIDTDSHAHVVVEALLMIAKSMDQKVVIEGIETPAQLTCIRDLGCEYGQGFLFDRALSPEQLAARRSDYELPAMSA